MRSRESAPSPLTIRLAAARPFGHVNNTALSTLRNALYLQHAHCAVFSTSTRTLSRYPPGYAWTRSFPSPTENRVAIPCTKSHRDIIPVFCLLCHIPSCKMAPAEPGANMASTGNLNTHAHGPNEAVQLLTGEAHMTTKVRSSRLSCRGVARQQCAWV